MVPDELICRSRTSIHKKFLLDLGLAPELAAARQAALNAQKTSAPHAGCKPDLEAAHAAGQEKHSSDMPRCTGGLAHALERAQLLAAEKVRQRQEEQAELERSAQDRPAGSQPTASAAPAAEQSKLPTEGGPLADNFNP